MTDQADALTALKGSKLFSGVSDDTLQRIAGIASRRRFEEGDDIYGLGDEASEMFLIESGRVRFSLGVGNRASAASVMTPGTAFGWAALLGEAPRRVATATCLDDTSVFCVPGRELVRLFEADTRSGFVVMRRLADMISRDLMSVMTT